MPRINNKDSNINTTTPKNSKNTDLGTVINNFVDNVGDQLLNKENISFGLFSDSWFKENEHSNIKLYPPDLFENSSYKFPDFYVKKETWVNGAITLNEYFSMTNYIKYVQLNSVGGEINDAFVKYIGAITDVDLGNFEISANNFYKNGLSVTWTEDSTLKHESLEMVDCMFELQDARVICGTGHNSGDGKLWYSDNEGESWTESTIPITTIDRIYDIIQLESGRILVGMDNDGDSNTLMYSDDNGLTYSLMSLGTTGRRVYSIYQLESGRILCGTADTEGVSIGDADVFYSDNEGISWTKVNVHNTLIAVHKIFQAKSGRIFLGVEGAGISGSTRYWYSDDDGLSYSEGNELDDTSTSYIWSIIQSYSGRIIIGTSSNSINSYLCYSDDDGDTWNKLNITDDETITRMYDIKYLSNGKMLIASRNSNNADAGVYYSEDDGISWTKSSIDNSLDAIVTIEELQSGRVLIGSGFSSSDGAVWYSDDIRNISNLYSYIENIDRQITGIINGSIELGFDLDGYQPIDSNLTFISNTITDGLLSITGGVVSVIDAPINDYPFEANIDLLEGDLCALLNNGKMTKVSALDVESTGLLMFANEDILTGVTGSFINSTIINKTGLTIGQPIYLSTTPGEVSESIPNVPNSFIRMVGYAVPTGLLIDIDKTWVEVI